MYVDPDQRWMSGESQQFLRHHSIELLDAAATESPWQLCRVEIAQKILRCMAQQVCRTTPRPPEEVVECCASVRNEHLKKHGHSSAHWFLGREPRVPGSMADCNEQQNLAIHDLHETDRSFAHKMHNGQLAAHAFIEAHEQSVWKPTIPGRNRVLRAHMSWTSRSMCSAGEGGGFCPPDTVRGMGLAVLLVQKASERAAACRE